MASAKRWWCTRLLFVIVPLLVIINGWILSNVLSYNAETHKMSERLKQKSEPPMHYQRLSIPVDADDGTIKAAFKREARKWHPDKLAPEEHAEGTRQLELLRESRNLLLGKGQCLYDMEHDITTFTEYGECVGKWSQRESERWWKDTTEESVHRWKAWKEAEEEEKDEPRRKEKKEAKKKAAEEAKWWKMELAESVIALAIPEKLKKLSPDRISIVTGSIAFTPAVWWLFYLSPGATLITLGVQTVVTGALFLLL
ncbi:hypothetical protein F4778DRAFT_754159 [Xylariomycetidae sp. FL2044]|nr:hypothetical protein F4778DRAFT_754159 [Xylariomycetidae sp. FL2044]